MLYSVYCWIKFQDDTVGLSRKEERELKKALYASLQESRRLAKAFDLHVSTPVTVAHPTRQSVKQAGCAVSSAPVTAPVTPVKVVTARSTRSLAEERNQETAKSVDLKKYNFYIYLFIYCFYLFIYCFYLFIYFYYLFIYCYFCLSYLLILSFICSFILINISLIYLLLFIHSFIYIDCNFFLFIYL